MLGLGDYVRKCGFSSVVVGLSGGIDSALTAALAVAALGKEKVIGVAMPSRFSSEHSVDGRQKSWPRTWGSHSTSCPSRRFTMRTSRHSRREFAGRPPDVTEENIQARMRGGLLMAFSNKFNHLLLTTGNKSELAVGYCTLYGDMCGGLAIISDVPKTTVWELSELDQRTRRPGIDSAKQHRQGPIAPSFGQIRPIRIRCRPIQCWMRFCSGMSKRKKAPPRSSPRDTTPERCCA